ncbi:carboxypeptidase-like regulatory domain-containing protein [Bacteroidales bacterium OttesenSCG-928-L03]|nr:carboxypeptidase-like regulatory domain-containing protein [Bacteroidales bacterium OttesenSCG-928-L03]
MKKKRILFVTMLVAALTTSLCFTSCKDKDEPEPDIVTEADAFYIIGEVLAGGDALAGVQVVSGTQTTETDADGTFKLTVDKRGDHRVVFSKTGYVTVSAEVTFASNVDVKSSVALKQTLTATNPPVTVQPDKETEVEEGDVALVFAPGSLTEATDISITPFTEGAKKETSGATELGLMSFNAEPSGLTFGVPVTLRLKNPMGGSVHFGNVEHFVEKNYKWEKQSTVAYDKDNGTYLCELTGFSNHSLRLAVTTTAVTKSTESLATKVIDNLGKVKIKEEQVTLNEKVGWQIEGNLETLLKNKYSSLTTTEVTALAAAIHSTIASLQGSEVGISEISSTMTLKVSGDTKMTVEFSSEVRKFSVLVPLAFADGSSDTFTVPVKKYAGTSSDINYEYGNSHPDHSGGSGK